MQDNPQVTPFEVYGAFIGEINQATTRTLIHGLSIATQNNPPITHFHLLFQSTGGFVGDGICLYNFFRNFPIELTVYNVGSVQSIATIAYLGSKERKVSQHGTFMLHRTTCAPAPMTSNVLESVADSVKVDDARTEVILREHLKMSDAQWSDLRNHQFWLTAADAVKGGLATSVGEFCPPLGQKIFSLS